MSGQDAAGVPGIKLAHLSRIGWHARHECRTDVLHESQRRGGRNPDSQHPGSGVVGIAETVPVPAGRGEHRSGSRFERLVADDSQLAVEDVDRLVEVVVRVGDRPGEIGGDGDLHGGEPGGLSHPGQDVHRLACIREARALARAGKKCHASLYQPQHFAPPLRSACTCSMTPRRWTQRRAGRTVGAGAGAGPDVSGDGGQRAVAPAQVRRYLWSRSYSAAEYLARLSTYSGPVSYTHLTL